MSSGPIVALVLAKENAIAEWRRVMGPTNPQEARESYPDTVRALYGKGTGLFMFFKILVLKIMECIF